MTLPGETSPRSFRTSTCAISGDTAPKATPQEEWIEAVAAT